MNDPLTIIGISAVSAIMSLVVMGSLSRNRIPGSSEWCWANACLALGMILTINLGTLPSVLTVIAANACTGMATVLQLLGIRRFYRRHTPLIALVCMLAMMLCFIAYFQYIRDDFASRAVVYSVYHALLSFAIGYTVQISRPRDRPKYGYVFMIGMAYITTFLNLVRGAVYVSGTVPDSGPLYPAPIHLLFLSIATMAAPAMTIGMVMMAHDRMSAALERHANIDFLTDLLGRRAFMENAAKELSRATRFSRALSVAIIDIDFFKLVNDRYGHAVGDDLLAHFAKLLSSSMRSSDICGRIGGEEFAMVLPETSMSAAVGTLQRLRDILVAYPCPSGNRLIAITFSAGVAELAPDETLEALIHRADQALYRAKQAGRDRIACFQSQEIHSAASSATSHDTHRDSSDETLGVTQIQIVES